ncbi:MAG: 2-oxoglutarate and iron-dependent oxygenase domain-containing protein, partial [Verrucomicrobiota bacterium]|nr:2-oxoglutarate and iron-dependent oxygenase domain-containing protein [Verrucomicrobiota bacterium]
MRDISIPTISLQSLDSSAHRTVSVQTVGQALEQSGFFIVTDHGISAGQIADCYRVAETFFSLPEETKRIYRRTETNGQRGFTEFGREHAKDSEQADLKEFFQIGREGGNSLPPNTWPSEVPEFRETIGRLYRQLESIGIKLLGACSEHLGLEPEFLPRLTKGSDSILRVIHYPPIERVDNSAARAAPHQDINFITLLIQATGGGLELQTPDGDWVPIDAKPNQLIVDSCDMMANLTNGRFRSTMHRVV